MKPKNADTRLEQILIGSLVIAPEKIKALVDEIKPEHFYSQKARACFEALVEMDREGVPIDAAALSGRARQKITKFDDALDYIIQASSIDGFNAFNALEYAKTIKSLWQERQKVQIATDLVNKGDIPKAMDLLENISKELAQEWVYFTLDDCYQPRPPTKFLAGNIFQEASLNIVYGAPGCFKSFLLADLLVCVASGEKWLPPAPWIEDNQAGGYATTQTPAVWIDFDNGVRRTKERFDALGKARKLPGDIPLIIYSMPLPWLQSTDRAAIGRLSMRILEQRAGIVCIDNLGDILGDADENSADMAKVMSNFRQVAEETGAAIILIHHQRKNSGLSTRAGESLRGHSSIEAALDLALSMDREAYSDTVTITCTKSRGDDILPFRAQFTKNEDGDLTEARFFGLGIDDNASNMAIRRAILEVLIEPMNKTAIKKAVKEELPDVGINRIRDEIDRMANTGQLSVKSGDRSEKIYYVN